MSILSLANCESGFICTLLTYRALASLRHQISRSHSGISESQASQSYLPSSVFRSGVGKWREVISYLSEVIEPFANESPLQKPRDSGLGSDYRFKVGPEKRLIELSTVFDGFLLKVIGHFVSGYVSVGRDPAQSIGLS